MSEEISNGAAIAMATAVAVGILGVLALLYDADQDDEARKIGREIKAGNCPIKVTAACGDEICNYTARVPLRGAGSTSQERRP